MVSRSVWFWQACQYQTRGEGGLLLYYIWYTVPLGSVGKKEVAGEGLVHRSILGVLEVLEVLGVLEVLEVLHIERLIPHHG